MLVDTIELLALDIDGVVTDGKVSVNMLVWEKVK